ncbi:hypothetical protein psal_cds_256 [Pandoravirus salinus]|uniref:Ankyrin repeat domain containing protein n=1 Tax=Pandoravirus salinus TaxID=1349410 RepID=S4W0B9_9VIRU|nr:hypothetical protein psal_cds_256 [Pandoravirus salinus]AGO83817.2 hypothetical protein psal_cds_256 [Pandoravirus salinus]
MEPTTIDCLPAEILSLVLNTHLAKPWRPLAARVSHAWRAVVALDVEAAMQRVARRHGKTTADHVDSRAARRANPLIIGKHTLAAAAAGSHVALLRWLVVHPRVRVSDSVVCAAAFCGAIDTIAFFVKHKPDLVRAAARYAAARGGQKTLLQWFHTMDLGRILGSASGDGDDISNDAIRILDDDDDDDDNKGTNDDSATPDGDYRDDDDSDTDDGHQDGQPCETEDDDDVTVLQGDATQYRFFGCDAGHRARSRDASSRSGDSEPDTDVSTDDDGGEFVDRDEMWPVWRVDEGMQSDVCDYSGSCITDDADADELEDWWGPSMCANAARGGHLDLLKWLRGPEVRCRWDSWTTSAAAAGGHAHVLSWALAECAPPCRIRHDEAIEWAARAPRNNVQVLAAILATGHAPTIDNVREVLSWGQTEMADLMLQADPATWQPDGVLWWAVGTDARCEKKDARRHTLLWAVAKLDGPPSTWTDTLEIALTYAALVGHHDDVVKALCDRNKFRSGDAITDAQAEKVNPRGFDDVASVLRAGARTRA